MKYWLFHKPSQIHLMVQHLPSSEVHHWWKLLLRNKLNTLLFFTGPSEAMVVLHTYFALLYLRGGLCWVCGLACRRSTAIFTSENKSIQTLNKTVTCQSAYVFTQNGVAAPTLPRSKWKWAPLFRTWKSKLDEVKMQQIQLPNLSNFKMNEKRNFFPPIKIR